MKHLKTFESKGDNGKKLLNTVMHSYDRMCDTIKDFINFEGLVGDEIRNVVYYYYETNVEKIGDRVLFVVFGDYEKNQLDIPAILINNKNERKLHEFIEDPELYKSTKKYNL